MPPDASVPAAAPAAVRPTPGQLAWQEAGFGIFLHFGINTFHGMEWSDGTLDSSTFRPAALDAAQWVDVAQRAGARYLVFTAKHHDGFCLWPTDTTDYSVRSAPWRDGRGDVVGELAEACRAAGMPLGLYVSPWDRNAACYDDPGAYDRFYCEQITELPPVTAERLTVRFSGHADAAISAVAVFRTGHSTIPRIIEVAHA